MDNRNRNYSNLGDQIRDTVQDALDTMNFNRLNQDITNSVKNALDDAKRGLRGDNNQNIADEWIKKNNHFGNNQPHNENYSRTRDEREKARDVRDREKEARYRYRQGMNTNRSYNNNYSNNTALTPRLKNPPGWVASTVLQVFGYTFSSLFGIAITVLLIVYAATITVPVLEVAIGLSPALLISLILLFRGNHIKKRLKRYKQYVRVLTNKSYCNIKELASNVALPDKFVVKDLKRMIQLGMFPEGHLDEQNTCLILNNETYQQYLKTLDEYHQREKEEYVHENKKGTDTKQTTNQGKKDEKTEYVSEELKKTIEEGKTFINKIRMANDAIPGEEISRKLERLEEVISKIFECVTTHPEQLSELKKFMEYYLPTTLKLVSAYEEFDRQPVQGENIRTAKNEIEKTLDTINLAFENLLDSLYEDAAMEISTDISVLETLLKREGLTEKDFDITKGGK